MIINGEHTIFFWSLWFIFKWSTLFSYIYLVKKGKWKPQIYLAIIWISPSHCWIHVLATLNNRALVNILQMLRMLMTAYLTCKGNFCIRLVTVDASANSECIFQNKDDSQSSLIIIICMHKQWLPLQGISEARAGGGWIRMSVRAVAQQNAFAMWSSASRASGLQHINHLQVLPGVDMLTPVLSHQLLWNWKAATDDSFLPIHYTLPCAESPLTRPGRTKRGEKERRRDKETWDCSLVLDFLDPTVWFGFVFVVVVAGVYEKRVFWKRLCMFVFLIYLSLHPYTEV